MKKFTSFTAMLLLVLGSVFTLSSCDAIIADSLEGTWEGDMYMSYGNCDAAYSKIEFTKDPFKFTKGTGYWVDYYSNAPWDYIANHITWSVNDRVITIKFEEEGTICRISDYHLDDDHFIGWIDYNGTPVKFDLVHTYSPNWDNFDWYEDDAYVNDYYNYYYSKGTRSTNDSTTTKIERPHRFVRAK